MTLVSQSDFAASHGVSRKTATKWKQAGRLVFVGEKVDVEASDALLRDGKLGRFKDADGVTETVTLGNKASAEGGNSAAPGGGDVAARATLPPLDLDAAGPDLEQFIQSVLAGQFYTQAGAERVKENAIALKHVLAVRKEAGEVIDIETAESAFFEIFRSERDGWMTWPSRIGPLLAADLDMPADKVVEVLTRYVHEHLEDLGEKEPDFSLQS